MRAYAARLLVRPSARMLRVTPLAVAAILGGIAVLTAGSQVGTTVLRLRGAGLLLAVALVFALDDAAAEIADAAPLPRWLRAFVRAVVHASPAAVAWLGVLTLASARSTAALPASWLSVEAFTLAIVGWATAASWRRVSGDIRAGTIAGPVLVVLVLVAYRLPTRWSLLAPGPNDPAWPGAQARWVAVLTGAVVVLVAALADPASTSRVSPRLGAAARRFRSPPQLP